MDLSLRDSKIFSVTAVITAYNNAQYIGRAIESVLNQTYKPEKIIVINDGSTDNTEEAIALFKHNILYIHQKNCGASGARNCGILKATSTWIAFLDGDDEWLPDHLERSRCLIKENPHLHWTTGNFITCLAKDNRSSVKKSISSVHQHLGQKAYFDDYFSACVNDFWGHTNTMIVQKETLIEAGLFKVGQLIANDLDMWFRIAYLYPSIGYNPTPTAIYYLDIDDSISKKYKQSDHKQVLIANHLALAKKQNRLAAFEPCASKMLKRWIRSMLFDKHKSAEIKILLKAFSNLYTWYYKLSIKCLLIHPPTTGKACHGISAIIRKLNLRREVVKKHSS